MKLYDRKFELVIRADGRDIVVRQPQRIVFTCDKSISGGLNKLNLQVFNLNETNRLAIVKDAEQEKRIPLVLRVGYADSLETIFQGTVHRSSNGRSGASLVSSFECLDGGFDYLNGYSNQTVQGDVVDAILLDLPNTRRGKITQLPELSRPKVIVGNPINALKESLAPGETIYIDNERINILRRDEVISSYVPRVSVSSGLLSVPEKEASRVTFDSRINPALRLGGLCDLRSTVAPYLNGVYRIESFSYNGDSQGNDWKQSVTALQANNFRSL